MAYPRKPTKIKLIEGTLRTCRTNPDEPEYPTEIPGCPHDLSPLARAEWYRIAPELEEMGLIAKVSRTALAHYCQCYARWVEAEREIANKGLFFELKGIDKDGVVHVLGMRRNPCVDISLRMVVECRHLASEFGMTPASQGKVHAKKKEMEKDDGKSRFFK